MINGKILAVTQQLIQTRPILSGLIKITDPSMATLCSKTHIHVPGGLDEEACSLAIATSLINDNAENEQHTEVMEQLASHYSAKMDGVMDFTRNKVIPTTVDMIDRINAIIANVKAESPTEVVTVKAVKVSPLAKQLLSKYKSLVTGGKMPHINITRINTSEMTRVAMFEDSESPQRTEVVMNWLGDLSPEDYAKYESIVYGGDTSRLELSSMISKLTAYQRLDFAIFVLSSINQVTRIAGDSTTQAGIDALGEYRRSYKRFCAELLERNVKIVTALQAKKYLVVRSDSVTNKLGGKDVKACIQVDNEIYEEYLSEGGTTEMLIGRALSTEKSMSMKAVLDDSLKFTSVYRKHGRVRDALVSGNILKQISRQLYTVVADLRDKLVEEGVYSNAIPEDVLALTKAYLNNLGKKDLEDVDAIAKTLIADILLARSPAGMIMSNMESIAVKDVEDADECAFMAVAQYLIDHLASQVECVADDALPKSIL